MKPIILASTSPRRKELLEKLKIPFKIEASNYEEDMTLPLPPRKLAVFLSFKKAEEVSKRHREGIIIGADTFVVCKNKILGKPHTPEKAFEILKMISGQTVTVLTGMTVIDSSNQKTISTSAMGKAYIKRLSGQEIQNYIATGEPLDKAGAFAIQERGASIVKKVDGDFFCIMGLPLYTLSRILKKLGVRVL